MCQDAEAEHLRALLREVHEDPNANITLNLDERIKAAIAEQANDYLGQPLRVGMVVCVGWKTATETKRTATVTSLRDGYVILDKSSPGICVVRPEDTLRVQ